MPDTPETSHVIRLRTPADLLAMVPYLCGFHPCDSLVVLGLGGRRVRIAARFDLPSRPGEDCGDLGERSADLIEAQQPLTQAILVGYGTGTYVTPVIEATRRALERRAIRVLEMLRVERGRFWSYLCRDPRCCPPEGVLIDAIRSPVPAAATLAGMVSYPDRAALVDSVAMVSGPSRVAIRKAAFRARARRGELARRCRDPAELRRDLIAEGRRLARSAVSRYDNGGRLTDDEVAWLALLLRDVEVRDHAWARVGVRPSHLALWADMTRRAVEEDVAAPACLLAFAAWRRGQGALASVALERARHADPTYPLAHLIERLLNAGVPPWCWTPPPSERFRPPATEVRDDPVEPLR